MAFHTLGVHRALQPWRIAGLRHWLMDSEQDLLAVRTGGVGASVRASATSATPSPPATSVTPAATAASAVSPTSPAPSSAQSDPVASRPERTHPQLAQPAAVPPAPPLPDAAATLPLSRWPESWRELLSRCPSSPVVLWTYPAMSDDYGGRNDPARRALLQRLLRDLALPPGSHAFWPMSAPPYTESDAKPENDSSDAASDGKSAPRRVDPLFFHSGLEQLSPLVVIFFGPPPQELGLPAVSALNSEFHLGRRLVHVPPTETLAANLLTGPSALPEGAGRHMRLVQFLKSQISGLVS